MLSYLLDAKDHILEIEDQRVRVWDDWSEIEEAASELAFLETDALPQLSHGI